MKKIIFNTAILIFFSLSILLTARSLFRITTTTAPDFTVFYQTTQDLLAGKNPYQNPNLFTGLGYPPNTLLFYIPLALLHYQQAQTIFTLLSFAAIIASVFLSLKIAKVRINWQTLFLTLSLTLFAFPTKFTLGMGQNNSIALLLLLLCFHSYQKNKPGISGIYLGLAISLKTLFGFFFLFFLLKRKFKILSYTIFILVTTIILTSIINHIDLYQYWWTKVIPPLLNLEGREIYYNQGLSGFFSRLTTDLALRKTLIYITSVILIAFTGKLTLKNKNQTLQFSLFIITLLLIDSLAWQHHFIWLIFPFIALTAHALNEKRNAQLLLLGIVYILVSFNFKNPSAFSVFPNNLLLSHVFFATSLLFWLNTSIIFTKDTKVPKPTIQTTKNKPTCLKPKDLR